MAAYYASFIHAFPCRRLALKLGAAAIAVLALGASNFGAPEAHAQGRGAKVFTGDISSLPPEAQAKIAAQQAAAQAGGQPQPQPGQQPGGEKPKEEKKKDGDKKDGGAETVKRPTEKPKAEAAELKVAPDKDGMVQFNFRGQAWTDVLEWYASIAKKSLDWQELPGDFLNLSTQRRHTLDETRDLLNRHLIARGFTMIAQGDVLTVVKLDKLDPSMVPRVEPDDLEDHLPHDYVRTRFAIPESMDPAKVVDDVKILLSPAAKPTPLLASRQLQVIDAAANLRDVRDLLYGEQMVASKDVRPKPFMIRHRRADYIADQVMIVLGLDPAARKTPQELQIEQQRMQLYMQMQQQGKDITKMLKQDGPAVFIAVDKRRNALLVNAPPKEMAMIQRTIEEFDVPEGDLTGSEEADSRQLTLKRHSTVSIGPDAVITALKDMGDLDPLTQLQSDSKSKTIFAYATPADHATIEAMIDKLDGTGRGLKVVWLSRRTSADQVAGTINALMVGEKKKKDNNRRDYWMWGYDRGDDDEQPEADFRIQADVENNRLLLWANDDEFAEVTTLLKELGAIASDSGSNPNKWRVLEARTPEETAAMIERLQQTWGGTNPLNINVAPAKEADESKEPADATPAAEAPATKDKITQYQGPAGAPRFLLAVNKPTTRPTMFLVAQAAETAEAPASSESSQKQEAAAEGVSEKPPTEGVAEPKAEQPAASDAAPAKGPPPPINITVTPDGRIVISSDDVAALDQLEDLLTELEPPRKDFEKFQLYNSRASLVSLNLEEYFADELSDNGDSDSGWWWPPEEESEDPATLGKRRKLRFIWDNDTNTIIAQNASPAQLQVIRELVAIYDQPISEDAVAKRDTDIIPIKYSRAQDIATAIKEVYRDLLSSKDKEFQGKEGDQGGPSRSERSWRFGGGSSNQKSAPMKVSFEGALSVGVDEISNSIIVSAEEQICKTVRELALTLDEKAKPDTVVQVHQLRGSLDAEELQDVLEEALSKPWPGGKPLEAQRGGGDQGGGDRGGGDRNRGDRGRDGDGDGDGDRGRRDRD